MNAKTVIAVRNVMLKVSRETRGIIHIDYLKKERSIDSDCNALLLKTKPANVAKMKVCTLTASTVFARFGLLLLFPNLKKLMARKKFTSD